MEKKNPEISTDFITTFAGNVGTPAMIFYTITTTGVTLNVFTEYFIYALIIIGGFSIVGIIDKNGGVINNNGFLNLAAAMIFLRLIIYTCTCVFYRMKNDSEQQT